MYKPSNEKVSEEKSLVICNPCWEQRNEDLDKHKCVWKTLETKEQRFLAFQQDCNCPCEVIEKDPSNVTRGNPKSWVEILWMAIDLVEFEGTSPQFEDDVKTAMAWIAEELEVSLEE